MKTITVGVIGHRVIDVSVIDKVALQVERFLKSIQQEYSGSKIKLQSPLAEGADRLVAKIALNLGIDLIVPLPLDISQYTCDFSTETSIKEFQQLCDQAEEVFVPYIGEIIDRTDAYYKVGSYTALTSNILLALWDQELELEKRGGTANIIREQFEGFSNELHLKSINLVCERKTYIIYTPRIQQPSRTVTGRYWTKKDYTEHRIHSGVSK